MICFTFVFSLTVSLYLSTIICGCNIFSEFQAHSLPHPGLCVSVSDFVIFANITYVCDVLIVISCLISFKSRPAYKGNDRRYLSAYILNSGKIMGKQKNACYKSSTDIS
jgi:hypothetical protein